MTSWCKIGAICSLLLIGSVLVACGEKSESEAESDYATALELLVNDAQTAKEAAEKEITNAGTAKQVGAAYSVYAGELEKLSAQLEKLKAPEPCQYIASAFVAFVRKESGVTRHLVNFATLSEAELRELVQEDADARKRLKAVLAPLFNGQGNRC